MVNLGATTSKTFRGVCSESFQKMKCFTALAKRKKLKYNVEYRITASREEMVKMSLFYPRELEELIFSQTKKIILKNFRHKKSVVERKNFKLLFNAGIIFAVEVSIFYFRPMRMI